MAAPEPVSATSDCSEESFNYLGFLSVIVGSLTYKIKHFEATVSVIRHYMSKIELI